MERNTYSRFVWWLGVATIVLLVYNLFAIYIFRTAVFGQKGTIDSLFEALIIPGFLLLPVFNLASIAWLVFQFRSAKPNLATGLTFVLGVLCCVMLLGEKAMIDEIARETAMGWGAVGEWVILYSALILQLGYTVLVLRAVRRKTAADVLTPQARQS